MIKKRIAAGIIVRNGIVVQSIGFEKYLPVGKPAIAIEYLNQWGIDEIILLDISATKKNSGPDFDMVKAASVKGFVPLTVGGGITTIEQMRELMHCGADKISLNQSAIHNPGLITKAANIFGNQCVVVAIDAVRTENGYYVYDYLKRTVTAEKVSDSAEKAESLGAGELLIHSVDRDGMYTGFDTALMSEVCARVSIPVIASGGAKNAGDFSRVFTETAVSAACAANFFHFTEHSVNITKSIVSKTSNIRVDNFADYADAAFNDDMRLVKKPDEVLKKMLFLKIEREII